MTKRTKTAAQPSLLARIHSRTRPAREDEIAKANGHSYYFFFQHPWGYISRKFDSSAGTLTWEYVRWIR